MISVVMPSYLGAYKRAAKERDKKIVRAIRSVQAQTYKDWELLVIADGCEKTVEIVSAIKDKKVKLHSISKQALWSGAVRNKGLSEAIGDYACYLDIDDAFAPDHLQVINKHLNGKAWYWTDDYEWNGENFRFRKCNIDRPGQCGTSNIIHKPALATWNDRDTYAHDWKFIGNLKRASKEYEYFQGGKYLVCHIPGKKHEL